MNRSELIGQIKAKKSFLCVGLDTDINRIPQHLLDTEDPIFEFNKQIIDATKDLCVAYKPNLAFYESMGIKGWEALQKTLNYIPNNIFRKLFDFKFSGNIFYSQTLFSYNLVNYHSLSTCNMNHF